METASPGDSGEERTAEEWRGLFPFGQCPRTPPCTPLLNDPLTVITQPAQWPAHICYGTLEASLARWCGETFFASLDRDRWGGGGVPLTVGRQAFLREIGPGGLLQGYYVEPTTILNLLPFAGDEQALPDDEEARQVVDRARRWWAQFDDQSVRGRPPGSTVSAADLRRAADAAHRVGKAPTQEYLAELLDCDPKTIQRAAAPFGGWRRFRASL